MKKTSVVSVYLVSAACASFSLGNHSNLFFSSYFLPVVFGQCPKDECLNNLGLGMRCIAAARRNLLNVGG